MPRTIDVWYDRCSAAKLRKFVEDRTGEKVPKMDKVCYVQRLVALDAQWTFPRFLALPPELRIKIYEHLLRLRDSKLRPFRTVCAPAILATSSEIQNEAEDVLYCENTFDIRIQSVAANWVERSASSTMVSFGKLAVDEIHLQDAAPSEMDKLWPTHIRRARHTRLLVTLQWPDSERVGARAPDFTQVNYVLHSLMSLRTGADRCLASLQVLVEGADVPRISDEILRSSLYPLAQWSLTVSKPMQVPGLPVSVLTHLNSLESRGEYGLRRSKALCIRLRRQRASAKELCVQAARAGLTDSILEELASVYRQAGGALVPEGVYVDAAFFARCKAASDALAECFGTPAVRDLKGRLAGSHDG
ncbi:hypothetical protein LTR53_017281 [Teratosphaeriaceae sp. CCFEE 6253]|nr:hypothetical protein LTR53_017281 [Teratosphaeriaceae sp. CCFEE 6253]